MTGAWMAYALLVGTLVALAAYAMDGVCRLVRRPTRWVWAGAMVLTVALIVLAPQRYSPREVAAIPVTLRITAPPVDTPRATIVDRLVASVSGLRSAIASTVASGFDAAARLASAPVERGLQILWAALSALALVVFLGVHHRLRRAKRAWPLAELHGSRVRLAPSAGPAVVGLARPEIVVPQWLLQRSDTEQRLVVAHEAEHLRAHDPLLLTVACVSAALVAWHPAMWWMFSRLRLAVELDCDDRIVRSGVTARSYGALLIDLADRCTSGVRIGAPALADGSSHLERRLIAMTSRRPKYARTAASVLAACSVALFALACDAKLPTSEEVSSMNVSTAENAARRVTFLGAGDSTVVYTIDGRSATADEAHALAADQIAAIEVLKKQRAGSDDVGKESGEVHILTKGAADAQWAGKVRSGSGDTLTRVLARVRMDTTGKAGGPGEAGSWTLSADTIVLRDGAQGERRLRQMHPVDGQPFNGVLLLDGVRVDGRRLAAIPPGEIVSIEVVKGDAARRLYADSAAANGVIRVTTRGKTAGSR